MIKRISPILILIALTYVFPIALLAQTRKVVIYPMPTGETINKKYTVYITGKPVPVYNAKVGAADPSVRFKAVDDLMHSEEYFDTAAFAYADIAGSVDIVVRVNANITSAKILPSAANIKPIIRGKQLLFKTSYPRNLTIEINGDIFRSLHLFLNPIEKNKPNPRDTNVIYYGPGIHRVNSLVVGSNKTVYLAGGAILQAAVGSDEKFTNEPSGLRNYSPTILLMGNNIKFKGRGILDAELCPTHARNMVTVYGKNISIEGIILRNSSGWTLPVRQSEHVVINNVKILGYRANTDGIDICNSRDVLVKDCFVRTNDDLIVVKSWEGQGQTNNVVVEGCVLWNQLAHALSLGAELRENVNNIVFKNCDVIHDQGREWSLRIFHADASTISNIRFEKIRIEESRQLISLWTGKNVSSFDRRLGNIKDVTFSDITAQGAPLSISLTGGDSSHLIQNVIFQNILINKRKITLKDIGTNSFVKEIRVVNN